MPNLIVGPAILACQGTRRLLPMPRCRSFWFSLELIQQTPAFCKFVVKALFNDGMAAKRT